MLSCDVLISFYLFNYLRWSIIFSLTIDEGQLGERAINILPTSSEHMAITFSTNNIGFQAELGGNFEVFAYDSHVQPLLPLSALCYVYDKKDTRQVFICLMTAASKPPSALIFSTSLTLVSSTA